MPELTRGFLITIEGIDGSGKDTQFWKVHEWLDRTVGFVHHWMEPNDQSSLVGQRIRAMLRDEIPIEPDPYTFQRMYAVDRAQSIFCFMRPALSMKHTVLLQRYALSTIAYGMLSGRSAEDFIQLHRDVCGEVMVWPDITIVIDVPARVGLERIARRRRESGLDVPNEFFERADKLARVRECYLELARRTDIGGVAVVNGGGSPEEVFAAVRIVIEPQLPLKSVKESSCRPS